MRHRLFIPAATALLIALTACTQDELADGDRLPEGEYPVVIRATGLSVEATPQAAPSTRATVDGDWQGVQTVALKMGDAVKEYTVTATDADGYKSATLSCENDPHYWTSRDPITVSAWWPLDDTDITRMPAVKVAEDQSTLAAFQGSDFISAENRTVEFDNPTLEFTHRTARVAIELKPGTGFTSVDGATVSLVSLSTDNENPTAIQTYHASGNSYEALTAPQTVAKGEPFIRVELGGGNFYFRPQNDVVLEAGNRYTYTVKVNATGLTLAGCEIGKWDDGGGESGAAEEFQDYTYDATANTYTVYTADGLKAWAEAAQSDFSLNCILAADITLPTVAEGESNWTPIGTYDHYYSRYIGTFDGGGHAITGLTINQSGTDHVGLFGCIGGRGTVKNLTLENVNIIGHDNVGGVVGSTDYDSSTVTGCTVSGTVSGNSNVGGVVGYHYASAVSGCTASGDVTGMGNNVGGVVGHNNSSVTACYHASGSVSGANFVGGVVGYTSHRMTACYNASEDVTSKGDFVGSVAGYNDMGAIITACYWSNYDGNGIGANYGTGTHTKVDGTTVTWQTAVDAMNAALQYSEWRYELTGSNTLPVLQKKQ